MVQTEADVRQRYKEALDVLVEKLKQDPYILAAILFGSLSYDTVWEKSDIDLILIGKDEKKPNRYFSLVQDGINVHAILFPRSKFRQWLEGGLQGSFVHSSFVRSTLLFSRDETFREFYENTSRVGARDRELQLMLKANWLLALLTKSEKWLVVKKDPAYSFLWLLYAVTELANIEVILHNEVPGREVIHQALKLNPEFFGAIYTDMVHGEKSEATMRRALKLVDDYLDEKIYLLFKPILDYLAEEGGIRTTWEMNEYFKKQVQTQGLDIAYEWLADRGIISKVPQPLRLHEKSPITVDEAAYYYDDHGR
jgi:predicted nucleotidyltransferase